MATNKLSKSQATRRLVRAARVWAKTNATWLASLHLVPTSRSAHDYGLPDAAVEKLTPFLCASEGSAVAIWATTEGHEIVLLGSEGENLWLAPSTEIFEANVREAKSGLHDVDGDPPAVPSATKTLAFQTFLEASDVPPPTALVTAALPLRELLVLATKERPRGYWQEDWLLTGTPDDLTIDWYAGGRKPYPADSELRAAFARVLAAVPKRRKEHRITLDAAGTLYVDGKDIVKG